MISYFNRGSQAVFKINKLPFQYGLILNYFIEFAHFIEKWRDRPEYFNMAVTIQIKLY